jgi:hypothetical protein
MGMPELRGMPAGPLAGSGVEEDGAEPNGIPELRGIPAGPLAGAGAGAGAAGF